MPLDWNMFNLVWIKFILTNTADFIHTLIFPDGFTAGSIQSNCTLRVASFGGDVRSCVNFSLQALMFPYVHFNTIFASHFFAVWCLLEGFPLLPAPVCDGLTWWLFTAINPSDRDVSVMLHTSGGRCWWHVLLCHHSPFPSRRGGGEEEESAHWVSHDLAGARVGRWWVDKLWGSEQMSNEVTILNREESEGPARDWRCN